MNVMIIPIVVYALWGNPQRIGKRTERLGNKGTGRDHPDNNIKIGQKAAHNPGVLRRFNVTQALVKKHMLTLVGKNFKEVNNNTDTRDPFSSGPERNLNKWTKEQEN